MGEFLYAAFVGVGIVVAWVAWTLIFPPSPPRQKRV
jgi:hypothetical protein